MIDEVLRLKLDRVLTAVSTQKPRDQIHAWRELITTYAAKVCRASYDHPTYADGVVAICTPVDDIPSLPGFEMEEVLSVLRDGTFTHVAMLDYGFLAELRRCAALRDAHGRWWDLKGQELVIEKRARGCAYDHRAFGKSPMH